MAQINGLRIFRGLFQISFRNVLDPISPVRKLNIYMTHISRASQKWFKYEAKTVQSKSSIIQPRLIQFRTLTLCLFRPQCQMNTYCTGKFGLSFSVHTSI